ncbi:glycosyltransferase [Methanolobus mangrovi]|uniref:Glycosyltransferase n=1 Tax=Methanolobus mangrovi TaxID=3072977 RepID=A0AA51YJ48_9EURY|nr:glycosyltransferase [Methanolobus mangrovi]WMW22218.1 glycosyltransferase [Methanolobus mangrovi]
MKLAPIALFVYNRPEHTRKTLESLINNTEFIDSSCYIFCDGAKNEKDKDSVQTNRELIHSYKLENVIIIENKHNKGLAKSLVDGINYVFQEHDRIIVLEDDCVPSPDFLHFMNTCLSEYESDERIMNVSAYSPPIEIPEDYPYDIYFSYRFSSWGWGTWKRAWDHYSNDPKILEKIETSNIIKKKLDRSGLDLYPMLKRQINGKLNSWAIFWAINIIMNDGLSINPVKSRIMNIGHDGSGTHCSSNRRYDVKINKEIKCKLSFPKETEPDDRIIKSNYDFRAGSLSKRILYMCYHKINEFIDFNL